MWQRPMRRAPRWRAAAPAFHGTQHTAPAGSRQHAVLAGCSPLAAVHLVQEWLVAGPLLAHRRPLLGEGGLGGGGGAGALPARLGGGGCVACVGQVHEGRGAPCVPQARTPACVEGPRGQGWGEGRGQGGGACKGTAGAARIHAHTRAFQRVSPASRALLLLRTWCTPRGCSSLAMSPPPPVRRGCQHEAVIQAPVPCGWCVAGCSFFVCACYAPPLTRTPLAATGATRSSQPASPPLHPPPHPLASPTCSHARVVTDQISPPPGVARQGQPHHARRLVGGGGQQPRGVACRGGVRACRLGRGCGRCDGASQ